MQFLWLKHLDAFLLINLYPLTLYATIFLHKPMNSLSSSLPVTDVCLNISLRYDTQTDRQTDLQNV